MDSRVITMLLDHFSAYKLDSMCSGDTDYAEELALYHDRHLELMNLLNIIEGEALKAALGKKILPDT